MDKTIQSGSQVGTQIIEQGLFVAIASLFLIGVIGMAGL